MTRYIGNYSNGKVIINDEEPTYIIWKQVRFNNLSHIKKVAIRKNNKWYENKRKYYR